MRKSKKEVKTTMLRVLMSERERDQLERMCEMSGATMSEVVRRAVQLYEPILTKEYTRRIQAQRSAEKATSGATVVNIVNGPTTPTLEELRARVGAKL